MTEAQLLPLLILLPLLGSTVTAVLPAHVRGAVTVLIGLLTGALVVPIALTGGATELRLSLGGWAAPLGVELVADGASVVMLALSATVVSAVALVGAFEQRLIGSEWFWPLLLAAFAALNGVFIAADLFTIYVLLELLTLAAVALVALGGARATAAALRYLFVAVLGSLLYLFAIALVYAETGTLDLALAAQTIEDGPVLWAALALISAGMAAKMALFPLHGWLPVAHPAAPAAVSAVLSALVVKAALFVLWRCFSEFDAATVVAIPFANALGILGAAGVIWGGLMALTRRRLKDIIAYSTVAQMGYLALMLPLLQSTEAAGAWSGGILLAVGHGLAKAALFLAAGALILAYGSDELDGLEGAVSQMPLTVATIGAAGVSLAGLPPSLGFAGKWQLLTASLGEGAWWWVAVLLVGGLLTFAYIGSMIRATFNPPGERNAAPAEGKPPRVATIVPFALALASIVIGIVPAGLSELLMADLLGGGR